jgi:uncharacterized membrane protein
MTGPPDGRRPAASHRVERPPAVHLDGDRLPDPSPVGRPRLAGVDAARAVALVGMASVHVLPVLAPDGSETTAGAIAAGRASALFAVLAGVGVALATGGAVSSPTSPRPAASAARTHVGAAAGLLVRGALVALVGFALVELDPPVAVILPYYGLLFALATPLLRLRAPALGALAAVWCVLGPVVSHVLRAGREALPGDQPGFAALTAPGDLLRELALTGYYPVLPWATYLLAGMAVGRMDLRSSRVAAGLLGGGAAVAVAAAAGSALLLGPGGGAAVLGPDLAERRYGTVPTDSWWWLTVEAPHTGTPFDLAHTTGTALAVLGAALLLARVAPAVVWPLAAVGALPLTLYTLHVSALALYPVEAAEAAGVSAGTLLVVHLLAVLVIGVTLRAAGLRGPLEAAVGAVSGLTRRAVAGSAGAT